MQRLSPEEARVLGSLVEKQTTTPEHYPLTLNALVAACNQRTNREPVVDYDAGTVSRALHGLEGQGLVGVTRSSGGRAIKYLHRADGALQVDEEQLALLAVLLLRGPQTPGELRQRTERYVGFDDVGGVEERLEDLIHRDVPLIERLPRQPGQKEARYRSLLTGEPAAIEGAAEPDDQPLTERVAELERRVTQLEQALDRLETRCSQSGNLTETQG